VAAASNISLAVAALSLSEVQLLTQAMRAAGKQGTVTAAPVATFEPRQAIVPTPTFTPRQVIHPTPTYLPRPVLHLTPRIEMRAIEADRVACDPVVVHEASAEQPAQPPWKKFPWQIPPPPAPKVKLACYHPDITSKGMLLDFFI